MADALLAFYRCYSPRPVTLAEFAPASAKPPEPSSLS
jgi:hypothetical protein